MTYVTVCKQTVLRNIKRGENNPSLRIGRSKYSKPTYAHTFEANGKVRIVYDPKNPLPWGARAWIEVEN